MDELIKKLREERAKIWNQMTEVMDLATKENRDLTAEERSTWDKAEADLKAKTDDLTRVERQKALGVDLDKPADDHPELRGAGGAGDPDPKAEEKRVADAFNAFVRRGMGGVNEEQRQILQARYSESPETRAQGEATNSAGGYLVPPGYLEKITETMKAFGGLLSVANIIDTDSGQPLQWPSNDDTGNPGGILGENSTISAQDLVIGTSTLGAFTYTSNLIKVSLQLLNDSAFDLDTWIPKKIGQRIGRAVAAHLATGAGTTQPLGIGTAPTVGKTGATGQTLSVIYDDLVDLVHSIDPAYRMGGNCRWAMNDLTLAAIRKIKDSQNRPLWVPGTFNNGNVAGGDPDTLLGYPIVVDNGLPVMAANALSILFGDFDAGFIVRRVQGTQLMRLAERYADALQVGFFGFMRLDARPDDAAAVKTYKNSAT